jgi:polysaccharide pyruvyl transferase WcaK-like protein
MKPTMPQEFDTPAQTARPRPVGNDTLALPATALINAYSTRNIGDAAIMTALSQLTPEGCVQVSVADAQPIDIAGVVQTREPQEARRFISVGGDIFNNARPNLLTKAFLRNIAGVLRHRERTMLFGQTIPASAGWLGEPLLARALRTVGAVVVRDCESFELLRRHGVEAQLSFDAAFALDPSDRGVWQASALFSRAGLKPERTALLSVRSFDSIYRHDQTAFLDRMARTAELLIGRGHQVAVLIQSDVNARDSDRIVAAELKARVPELVVLDLLADDDLGDHVATLIGALTIANIVVAVRYHAAILRLVGRRVPYNLYYSRKGQDLDYRLNLPGCALESFDPDAEIDAIEATADAVFNPAPISQHVRSAFDTAYARLA